MDEGDANVPGPDDQGKVLPLTGSGSGKKKKQGTLKLASWNCFGLSADRAEFLFGSEADRGEGGLFPSKGGGEWIVALQDPHESESRGLLPCTMGAGRIGAAGVCGACGARHLCGLVVRRK
eukprot:SAG22_NODE_6991_length_787_cov_1.341570_1_plen_121_part_00